MKERFFLIIFVSVFLFATSGSCTEGDERTMLEVETERLFFNEIGKENRKIEEWLRRSGNEEALARFHEAAAHELAATKLRLSSYHQQIQKHEGDFGLAFDKIMKTSGIWSGEKITTEERRELGKYFARRFIEVAQEISRIEQQLRRTSSPYRGVSPEALLEQLKAKLNEVRDINEKLLYLRARFQFWERFTIIDTSTAVVRIGSAISLGLSPFTGGGWTEALVSVVTLFTAFHVEDDVRNSFLGTFFEALSGGPFEVTRKAKTLKQSYWAELGAASKMSPMAAVIIRRLLTSISCKIDLQKVPEEVSHTADKPIRIDSDIAPDLVRVHTDEPKIKTRVAPIVEEFEELPEIGETQKLLQKRLGQ